MRELLSFLQLFPNHEKYSFHYKIVIDNNDDWKKFKDFVDKEVDDLDTFRLGAYQSNKFTYFVTFRLKGEHYIDEQINVDIIFKHDQSSNKFLLPLYAIMDIDELDDKIKW